MKLINLLIKFLKRNKEIYSKILIFYYKSIIYRKRHINLKKLKWLKDLKIDLLENKDGILKYKEFEFVLERNIYKDIPLHQKYLYAALIPILKIPKYYLLFWDDIIIFREIFIDNFYGKESDNLEYGDIVLDIGSSIGWYSLFLSKLIGKNGKVISIEPNPNNFRYLKKNIKWNNLDNIIAINKGIWSKKSKLFFTNTKYSSELNLTSISLKKKEIDVDSIDNLMKELDIEQVNLIKMDIEGAEIKAIKGALDTIKNSQRIILKIAAYHKLDSGIETYKILVPLLEKLDFKINKKYLPMIFAIKNNSLK